MIRIATLTEKHSALAYDLRQRINPLYADQRGTESYERRVCAEAIESLLAERAMLIDACGHYEAALHEAFPAGAYGHAFEHWNDARKLLNERDALAASKE